MNKPELGQDRFWNDLGGLKGNLLALEYVLRAYLFEANKEEFPQSIRLANLRVGERLPINHLTNYDTLEKLIKKYNLKEPNNQIDTYRLKALRDALAHGRVFSEHVESPCILVKYSKPKDSCVEVTFFEEMNQDWFKKNNDLVRGAVKNVHQRLELLGLSPQE